MDAKMSRFKNCLMVILLIFGNVIADASVALSPKEQIKESADRTLAILNDASLSEEVKKELLRKTILPLFDFNEIAKRVLARHWKANEPRMGEFIPLLNEFLETVYVNRSVSDYARGARIVVMNETIDGDFATVKSKIITVKGGDVLVDYRLRFNGNEWMVYDILIEGVSMVSNFRSQFNTIIQKSSFDGLLQVLRNKIQELENKK